MCALEPPYQYNNQCIKLNIGVLVAGSNSSPVYRAVLYNRNAIQAIYLWTDIFTQHREYK